jgi:hypothetical protein
MDIRIFSRISEVETIRASARVYVEMIEQDINSNPNSYLEEYL